MRGDILEVHEEDFSDRARMICIRSHTTRVSVGDIVRVDTMGPKIVRLIRDEDGDHADNGNLVYAGMSLGLICYVANYCNNGLLSFVPLERITEEQMFLIRMSGDASCLIT